jgi:phospholipase C
MRAIAATGILLAAIVVIGACGDDDAAPGDGSSSGSSGADGGPKKVCPDGQGDCNGACVALSVTDSACGAGSCAAACTGGAHCMQGTCVAAKIEHVVLIVQENHTFDNYYGKYCTAPAGSAPDCTTGRSCCEAAPPADPRGTPPVVLDDASNFAADRNHKFDCEIEQINGGQMNNFCSGASGADTCFGQGPACASNDNWAIAEGVNPTDTVHYYWELADKSALADRYFQPVVGSSSSNDMYFAGAHFRFRDNEDIPDVAAGTDFMMKRSLGKGGLCVDITGCTSTKRTTFTGIPTIASLMLAAGKTFAVYADGYAAAVEAAKTGDCADPAKATECPYNDCTIAETGHPVACRGCLFDPSDIPFLYYDHFADRIEGDTRTPSPNIRDYNTFFDDVSKGTLPHFAFLKPRVFRNEHPNFSKITDGAAFVKKTIDFVTGSPKYKDNTLVLVTWDEGGGFFDHVAPPAGPPADVDADPSGNPVPYGTRVPLIAVGTFAKAGRISHKTMEHSSIVKFIEYNFLTKTGQLEARDAWANGIGSVLDPSKTGIPIPE